MYSWWWVELSPETCRVKPLRRINANVASCWIYFTINFPEIFLNDDWCHGGEQIISEKKNSGTYPILSAYKVPLLHTTLQEIMHNRLILYWSYIILGRTASSVLPLYAFMAWTGTYFPLFYIKIILITGHVLWQRHTTWVTKFSGPSELTKRRQLKNLPYKGHIRAIRGPRLVMTSSSSSHLISHDLYKFKPFHRHPITVSYTHKTWKSSV